MAYRQSDYKPIEFEASKSVLIELVELMGEFRDHLVVIGGMVPSLLLIAPKEVHIGTRDIDVALDFSQISNSSYETILNKLRSRGYKQDPNQPFIFHRTFILDGEEVTVEVDLLAPEYGGTATSHRMQRVQDVLARKARGSDICFDDSIKVTISGQHPDGGKDTVTCNIAGIVSFLVMKGFALGDRRKEKDAYDIYYCIDNYTGGIDSLVMAFEQWRDHGLVVEAMKAIRLKFETVEHIGPKDVVDFMEEADEESKELLRRRVFETVDELLVRLGQ